MEKKDSPKGPPKKKSSLKANLILLLLSLVFSFFMAEIGARIFYKISHRNIYMKAALQHAPNGSTFVLKDIVFPSKNPRLFYELIPDRSGIFQGRPYGSNSHGLRGGETTVEKPAGTWRIASLGDSTMFGWAVKVEACYMSILEKTLNEAGDKLNYEILNFAVPGYNTAMEAETFKKRASAFSPDLVLLQFDINDLVLPNFVLAPRDMWTLKRCYLWGLVEKLVKGRDAGKGLKEAAFDDLQKAPETEESREQGLVKYFEYRAQSTPQQYKEIVGWDGVKRALNSLWNDSNQPVVHLSWTYQLFRKKRKGVEQRDHFSNFIKDAQKKREDGARLHYLDIMTVGKEFCRETGLRFARDLVVNYPVDYHPSEVRHILFARKIYLFLVEKRLLPENSLHYEKFESIAESLWQQARALVPQPRGMGSLPGAKLLLLPTWWGKV